MSICYCAFVFVNMFVGCILRNMTENLLSRTSGVAVRRSIETAEIISRPFGPFLHLLARTALKNMTVKAPEDIDYSQYRFRNGNSAEPTKIEIDITEEEVLADLASGTAIDEASGSEENPTD